MDSVVILMCSKNEESNSCIKSTPYVSCLNIDTRLLTPILVSIRLYPNSMLVDEIEINKLCSVKS